MTTEKVLRTQIHKMKPMLTTHVGILGVSKWVYFLMILGTLGIVACTQPEPTPVPTATATATTVPTATITATPVPTATITATPIPTATITATPVPTATPTATPVPTATPSATSVPTATSTPVPASTQPSVEDVASGLVIMMAQRDFAEVVTYFDATMSSAMPQEVMAQTWDALLAQVGAFQSIDHINTETSGLYQIVTVATAFTGTTINIQIVFDTESKVAGLFFKPAESYKPPPYANPGVFTEIDVVIGSAPWELPGTLTMPNGDGPFPAVVLVHGSGPNDRDETIGPNKPFKDLAWGLATEGVAVLRYEKRTAHYPAELSTMIDTLTIREEVIDDAKAAVDVLLATPNVDTANVSVIGHSLGGMLVPLIATDHEAIASIIILAGPTRPLQVLILEQTEYLAALDGTVDSVEQAQIDAVEALVAKINTLDFAADEIVLGGARLYWESLAAYDPSQTAVGLSIPIFVLQGARDYQVTMVDFQGWRDALAEGPNTQFREYSDLNHLFIPGAGPPSPQEYEFHGSVSAEVVLDIVAWIQARD